MGPKPVLVPSPKVWGQTGLCSHGYTHYKCLIFNLPDGESLSSSWHFSTHLQAYEIFFLLLSRFGEFLLTKGDQFLVAVLLKISMYTFEHFRQFLYSETLSQFKRNLTIIFTCISIEKLPTIESQQKNVQGKSLYNACWWYVYLHIGHEIMKESVNKHI